MTPNHNPPPATKPETWAQALQKIVEMHAVTPEIARRLKSDLDVAARCIGESAPRTGPLQILTLEDLPCDPVYLRPLLQRVLPSRHWAERPGQTRDFKDDFFTRIRHRWSGITSSIARVLVLTGWVRSSRGEQTPVTAAWLEVIGHLSHPSQLALLRNFARFCMSENAEPRDVSSVLLERYRDHRLERTMDLNVTESIAAVRRLWNRASKGVDANLPILAVRKRPGSYVRPDCDFPKQFIADVERYLAMLIKPQPLDDAGPSKRLSGITVAHLKKSLRRFASVLLDADWHAERLQTVDDLATPDAVRIILMDQYVRVGNHTWPSGSVTVAYYLNMVARYSQRLSTEEKAEISRLCGKVGRPRFGITKRNRDRVASFDDPRVFKAFMNLADDCYRAADRMYRLSDLKAEADGRRPGCVGKVRAARLHQYGLAAHFLVCKPLRRTSLASLNLERHFAYNKKGRPISFCIRGEETKNGLDAEALIPESLGHRIEIHRAKYLPLLKSHCSPFLFPGKYKGHIDPQSLANGLAQLVRDRVGIEFNIQLVRHLVATVILDDDPENGPIAQRLLDHSSLKTTISFYGAQRTRSAQAKYDTIIEKRMQSVKLPGRKPIEKVKKTPKRRNPVKASKPTPSAAIDERDEELKDDPR